MVFTLNFQHTFQLWRRELALVQFLVVSALQYFRYIPTARSNRVS